MARQKPKTDVSLPGTDIPLSLASLRSKIAMELAAGLLDAKGVREQYGISQMQWDVLRKTPVFREMVKDAMERLSGSLNAGNRIKLKSDVMLEDSLPVLYEIAHDKDAQSMARIKAIEVAAELAGRKQKETQAGGQGNAFALQIVIGDTKIAVTDQQPALEHTPDE